MYFFAANNIFQDSWDGRLNSDDKGAAEALYGLPEGGYNERETGDAGLHQDHTDKMVHTNRLPDRLAASEAACTEQMTGR